MSYVPFAAPQPTLTTPFIRLYKCYKSWFQEKAANVNLPRF